MAPTGELTTNTNAVTTTPADERTGPDADAPATITGPVLNNRTPRPMSKRGRRPRNEPANPRPSSVSATAGCTRRG